MAIFWQDGCDFHSDYSGCGASFQNTASMYYTNGRYGGGHVGLGTGAFQGTLTIEAGSRTTVFAQSAHYQTSYTGSDNYGFLYFMEHWSGPAYNARVSINQTGTLILYNANGVEVARSASQVIRLNTWHVIQAKCVVANNTGSFILKVDGVNIFNFVGNIDTLYGTGSGVMYVVWLNGGGAGTDITRLDDILLYDETGSAPQNTWLSDCRIRTLVPNADTADADWGKISGVDGYAMIDDTIPGAHDGDTTYIFANTVGDLSLFDIGDLSVTPMTIYGIKHSMALIKATSDARTMRGLISSNSIVQNGATRTPTTSWLYYEDLIANDPDGGGAWTKAKIDALKIGVEVLT